ncbi:MAG TPA: Holliday junction resolvase RuvX [Candidatus Paceibacterota bacterium]
MKLLGIDYGAKRVGVAVADTDAGLSFPKAVFPNDKFLLGEIKNLCQEKGIEKIILGESKNLKGEQNEIMQDIEAFKKMLELDLHIKVIYQPEFYSTAQAARIQGENDKTDASAAAIILQSYLDRYKK